MSFKQYQEYKDTEVSWLGKIPSHWGIAPLWTLFQRVKRTGFINEEPLSVYRDYGVVPKSSRDDNHNRLSEDLDPYQLVEIHDLVINKMKAFQGSVAISNYRGIVSPAYFVYKSNHSNNPRYLHYLMKCQRYVFSYLSISKGIRPNQWDLDPQEHSRLPMVLPPIIEQKSIVDFLDYQIRSLEALIGEQGKLIELSIESRQAIIYQTVTNGLDPNLVKRKTEIDWIPEIPEKWKISKVKYLFHIGRGRVISQETVEPEGLYPVYSSQTLDEGCFGYIDTFDFDCDQLTWTTDGANAGTVFLRNGKHNCTNVCGTLLPKSNDFNLKYLHLWLTFATQFYKRPDTNGAKIMNSEMAEIYVLLPSQSEQDSIAKFLQLEVSKFENLIAESRKVIEILQERRATLISEAVLGQIDVRNYQPKEVA